MASQSDPSEGLIAAITQASSTIAQGWIGILASLPWAKDAAPRSAGVDANAPRVAALQAQYAEKQAKLWTSFFSCAPGDSAPRIAEPDKGDKRFVARAWRINPYYNYLKQSYLLSSRYLTELVEATQLEPHAKDRLRFVVKQAIDASCPANFAATNPEVLEQAVQTNGESITRGLANLIADTAKGRISQSDESAFEVGRNLAATPGAVVFENELIQLIQYAPSTAKVGVRPLVMIPPCINKFYVLDLQTENSFVRYAVGEGHTVFMLSWRNPKAALGDLTWDDYLDQGVIRALKVAREISGSEQVNALGFCVGGTLLGAALAVLRAKGEDPVASVTYLATMFDFSNSGQIGCLVDEAGVQLRESTIGRGGILPGADLALVFSALRANDLIWPYVVNNYLKGETPPAFDILYWNADSTNLPGPMYCYYVRNTYLENRLCVPGALTNCGVPVDLGRIGLPSFIAATREDHIVPWKSAYRSAALLGGDVHFMLGASGHIAGIINPPASNKRSYWTGERLPPEPDAWLAQAAEHAGSWWPTWSSWLAARKGGDRRARKTLGSRRFKPIEPAPGRYVREKAL